MACITRWLYLNFKYRICPLPTDPASLEKVAKNLNIPLAFTYTWHGLDVTLAQQRIRENLNSFRWIVTLVNNPGVLCNRHCLVGQIFREIE